MRVLAHTRYRDGRFTVDGRPVTEPAGGVDEDLANAWAASGIDHPRFHRMDRLSRLVLVGTAPFFAGPGALPASAKDRVGLVIMGRNGSLDTDQRYQELLDRENMASPALFVYTLPNIAMGELSILHGLHGSGLCLLNERPDTGQLRAACEALMGPQGMRQVVCGWADIFAGRAVATFVLASLDEGGEWTEEQLRAIFHEH